MRAEETTSEVLTCHVLLSSAFTTVHIAEKTGRTMSAALQFLMNLNCHVRLAQLEALYPPPRNAAD